LLVSECEFLIRETVLSITDGPSPRRDNGHGGLAMKKQPPKKVRRVARKPATRVIRITEQEWLTRLGRESGSRMVEVAETFDRAQWIVARKAM
jgi:hypothetical protein